MLRNISGEILSVGAGDGTFEMLLKQINPHITITAMDIDPDFRPHLETIADEVIIGDFLSYKFGRKFKYIVSNDVIEHILDTDTFLEKTYAALQDDGLFYLQTPNLASWHGRIALALGFTPGVMEVSNRIGKFGKLPGMRFENTIHHVRVLPYRALCEMVRYYGFDILAAVGVDYRLPWLFSRLPHIAGGVCLKLRKQLPAE